jgi:putative salt-induced outer membrane protein YdiY
MGLRFSLLCAVLFLLLARPAYTQNQQQRDTTLIVYNAQLTGAYSRGGVNRALLTTTQNLTFTRGQHYGLPVTGNFIYGKQDGLLKERELLLNATPYYYQGRFRAYAIGGFERSNLRGITSRLQLGAGPGWAFYSDTLGREVSISNLIIRERTNFLDGTTQLTARNSVRLKVAWSVRILTLSSTTFYQPSLADFDNYRFSNLTTAALKLTSHLAVNLTYNYTYESEYSEGKVPANTNVTVGLSYTTRR